MTHSTSSDVGYQRGPAPGPAQRGKGPRTITIRQPDGTGQTTHLDVRPRGHHR